MDYHAMSFKRENFINDSCIISHTFSLPQNIDIANILLQSENLLKCTKKITFTNDYSVLMD